MHLPWPAGICGASSTQSRSETAPVDAARAKPKYRVCRWSSGRPPKTKLITASSCCVEPSQRLAKPGGDMTHIANVAVPAIRRLGAHRIVGIRSRPASDTRPDRPDRLPRSRTSSGTPAGTLERAAEAQSSHYILWPAETTGYPADPVFPGDDLRPRQDYVKR